MVEVSESRSGGRRGWVAAHACLKVCAGGAGGGALLLLAGGLPARKAASWPGLLTCLHYPPTSPQAL